MLQNLDFIKATVNGKKCGFVVYDEKIWLLSYVREWNGQRSIDITDIAFPRHGFHKALYINVLSDYESFEAWRNSVLHSNLSEMFGIETIAFPGEEGFERNIRRFHRNRTDTSTTETTDEHTPQNEGNGIDFYLPNYATTNVYQGQNSYHDSHRNGYLNRPVVQYSGHRIGIELEVEANDRNAHGEIVNCKSNWFTRERDGSLGSYGVEFISIPLLPEDAKSYATWQPLCDFLKTRAKSWNTGRCGLHVHIGREILGDTETERQMTLGKLLIFYQGDIEDWNKAVAVFGRERCYSQQDGNTEEIKAVKCLGKSVLRDSEVFNRVDAAMKRKFSTDRYFAVNLQNNATIEFRKGRGSINADRIIAVITFVESICLFCRSTDAHELTLDNFKSWLFNHVQCGNPVYRYLNITQQDA